MFQNNLTKKNLKNVSIKELYVLYKLFNLKHNTISSKKEKFNIYFLYQYSILVNGIFFNMSNTIIFKDILFLSLFFFNKTKKLKYSSLRLQDDDKHIFIKNLLPNVYNIRSKYLVKKKFSIFWEKWKELKRPKTKQDFDKYFLTIWEEKIKTYSNLNFLKSTNIFYSVRVKTENFSKNLVLLSNKLLSIPKYSSSSITKIITVEGSKNFEFQFLRKNKVYNKGRYSRCRQNYRTGVYMCMYLSIVSIFGLYYWFYKFSFNFTYLWWLFISFVGSFFLPKIIKYRLYEPTTLFNKIFDFFKWVLLVIKSLIF